MIGLWRVALWIVAQPAAARAPECPPPAAPASAVQVGLTTHGRQIGGLGIAAFDGAAWSLTLLAPAGFELFTVAGPPAAVTTGLEAWRPWLEKLPVERDLRLAFTDTDQACRAPRGHLRTTPTPTGWERRWCGAGGGATAVRDGGRVTLTDKRRGYTLTLLLESSEPDAPR
ncbi:MAG: DUF3261 domain-containing protein [Pseudomonadota bacterium]|nr:DUF3261 domain-containing protein [Pseudomonadota bacterium]